MATNGDDVRFAIRRIRDGETWKTWLKRDDGKNYSDWGQWTDRKLFDKRDSARAEFYKLRAQGENVRLVRITRRTRRP